MSKSSSDGDNQLADLAFEATMPHTHPLFNSFGDGASGFTRYLKSLREVVTFERIQWIPERPDIKAQYAKMGANAFPVRGSNNVAYVAYDEGAFIRIEGTRKGTIRVPRAEIKGV